MIEIDSRSSESVLGIRASERITDADYTEVMVPKLEAMLRESGKIRLLMYFDNFKGFEAKAMWEDAKFGLKHLRNIDDCEKLAIVGEPAWIGKLTSIVGHLVPGEFESFRSTELEEAWEWVEK